HSGSVRPGHERKVSLREVGVRPLVRVGEVQPGAADLDEHLTVAGPRDGDVDELQDLRAAELVLPDGSHRREAIRVLEPQRTTLAPRMTVTVVGSIAYDAVKTPSGSRDRMLGGAATHFALAASFFDEVRVVGPVGDDFADSDLEILATRGTSTDDVERVPGGKTFFWAGEYGWDLNSRETLDTQLGVFETFEPKLSEASRSSDV